MYVKTIEKSKGYFITEYTVGIPMKESVENGARERQARVFTITTNDFLKKKFLSLCFDRDGDSVSSGEDREGEKRMSSRLYTVSAEPNMGLELTKP